MKIVPQAFAAGLLVLAAGCTVKADENLQAQVENQTEAIGNDLENAAAAASSTLDRAGDIVENHAAAIENGVDVDVHLGGTNDQAGPSEK
jgi:hypothetical protein